MNKNIVEQLSRADNSQEQIIALFAAIASAAEKIEVVQFLLSHRHSTARALGLSLIDKEILPALQAKIIDLAFDHEAVVRAAAAQTFANFQEAMPVDLLREGLRDRDSSVRRIYAGIFHGEDTKLAA